MRTADKLIVHPWRPHWLCALGLHRWRTLYPQPGARLKVRQCRRCYLNKWEDL